MSSTTPKGNVLENGSPQYELLDFGRGRKLERFGSELVDRPSLFAANSIRKAPHSLWQEVSLRLERKNDSGSSKWKSAGKINCWTIVLGPVKLQLKPTPAGHLGFFPEHMQHWNWLASQDLQKKKIINLFGYTGATSLYLAHLGAEVTHVDSSRSAVNWARANAELSGMNELPTRWIVEDARRYVARELKRGNEYHGFIMDPPSYGHGVKGEAWKMEKHFEELLGMLMELGGNNPEMALITSHTEGFEDKNLSKSVKASGVHPGLIDSGKMTIPCRDGRELDAGWFVRIKNAR